MRNIWDKVCLAVGRGRRGSWGEVGRVGGLCLTGLFLVLAANAADVEKKKTKKSDAKKSESKKGDLSAGEDLFKGGTVPQLRIKISNAGMSELRRHSWQWGGGGRAKPTVQATVYEGDTVYTNVAIHLKGAAGSFRPVDDRPGLTLNFDKFAPGQKFHGLTKISLNNCVQDGTYLSEKVSREMFAMAGVPVPRAGHAVVELNGRSLGLYVLLEGYNKQFLRRHFDTVSGNLYDGEFCRDVTEDLSVNAGDKPEDKSSLRKLAQAAMIQDSKQRWARLNEVLDMDEFITMMVMESVTCHGDGYGPNRNNYRVFHDAGRDKMVFMPHGMDQMFGHFRFDVNGPLIPSMQGLVARQVLRHPEGKRRFLSRMGYLATNVFDPAAMTARIREMDEPLKPYFEKRGGRWPASHERMREDLCRRVAARLESIRSQLDTPAPQLASVEFSKVGIYKVPSWQPYQLRTDGSDRRCTFDIQTNKEGRRFLHVTANGGAVGSWRSKLLLEPGDYRLVGRAVTVMNPGDAVPGTGVLLRISGSQDRRRVSAQEWSELSYPFEVNGDQMEITLICEFQAPQGEAWFELDSLRVIKQ